MGTHSLTIDTADGQVLLSFTGEIELAAVDDARARALAAVEAHPGCPVVVDLGGVTFMDSSGLGMLVSLVRATESAVSLRNVSPRIRKRLDVTGLDDYFAGTAG